MLRDALHALRTLLFDPRSFFETHPPAASLGSAAAASGIASPLLFVSSLA